MPDAHIDRRCKHRGCQHKGHYVAMGRCSNCAWEGYVWITLGHTTHEMCQQAACPRCLCRTIKGGEFVEGNGYVAADPASTTEAAA